MVDPTVLITLIIIAITQMIKMLQPKITGWATIVTAFVVSVVVSILSIALPGNVTGLPRVTLGVAIVAGFTSIGLSALAAKAGGGAKGDETPAR